MATGIAKSVKTLTKVWKIRGSIPGVAEIFRALPTGRMVHPVPYTRGTKCFLDVKRPDSGANNPTSRAEVTNRLEFYHRLRSVPAPAGYVVTFTILGILSLLHFTGVLISP